MAAMTETENGRISGSIVRGEVLDGERALYNLQSALVEGCRFADLPTGSPP